jgi:hypothetical protein
MTTDHRCTGNPDPEPVPAHTCQRGPLCGAWPEDSNPDPGPLYGCEHGLGAHAPCDTEGGDALAI